MVVKRVENIGINNRTLFTAIYGRQDDYFIGSDLKKFNIWHQLYLLMKKEGYDSIIYFDTNNNFHSYQSTDLEVFLNSQNKSISNVSSSIRSYSNHIRIPNRIERKNLPTNVRNEPEHPNILKPIQGTNSRDSIYRLQSLADQFEHIRDFLQKRDVKTCLIYKIAESTSIVDAENMLNLFKELKQNYSLYNSNNKVIISYTSKDPEAFLELLKKSNSFFCSEFFISEFVISEADTTIINYQNVYYLGSPEEDELKGIINRERLLGESSFCFDKNYERIILKLIQETKQLDELKDFNLDEFVKGVSNKSAWDKLNDMDGVEEIKTQIISLIRTIRASRMRNENIVVRPHLCFKGNPGTGKTTIAKAVAEIFKEEGILSKGHLIEAKVSDLVGEYEGHTRPKTTKKCEDARGGVLFIDEAYGLLDKRENGFGKEAIDTLIQYMDDASWRSNSILIFAGYTFEIDELIKKGNRGFARRFPQKNHILFNDYEPFTLFNIFLRILKEFHLDPEFLEVMENVIKVLHQRKGPDWGNAGTIENIAQEIISCYDMYEKDDLELSKIHIPKRLLNLIEKDEAFFNNDPLEGLIGIAEAKSAINDFKNEIIADEKRRTHLNSIIAPKSLNFVFSGNPGTGKTTVARRLGQVLFNYGLINSHEVIEVGREDLVAGFSGQTAIKVKEVFNNAIGKVLFIDEAYSLNSNDPFGTEAINSITKNLTDPMYQNKMAVVMAGYSDDMEKLLQSNPGLEGRFQRFIKFSDYTNEELYDILILKAEGFSFLEGCRELAINWFSKHPRNKFFKNGRLSEQLFLIIKSNLDRSIVSIVSNEMAEELITFKPEHFPNYTENDSSILPTQEEKSEEVPVSITVPEAIKTSPSAKVTLVLNEPGAKPPFESFVGFILTTNGTTGTGFTISSNGYVVTAFHVVAGETNFEFYLDCEKHKFQLELVWFNFEQDIALLKIVSEKNNFPYIPINSNVEEELIQGEVVSLLGYPFTGGKSKPFYTASTISNYEKNVQMGEENILDAIYSYNQSTHGYSGGPLIRQKDNVVIGVLLGGIKEKANINVASDIRQIFKQDNLKISIQNIEFENEKVEEKNDRENVKVDGKQLTNFIKELDFENVYFDLDCFFNTDDNNQIRNIDKRVFPSIKALVNHRLEQGKKVIILEEQLDVFKSRFEDSVIAISDKNNFNKIYNYILNSDGIKKDN